MSEIDSLIALMRRRYACHAFRPDAVIAETDLQAVLEAGRLAPSSFGLEPWHFLVVRNPARLPQLQDACFGQPQAVTCSALVAILATVADMAPDSANLRVRLAREHADDFAAGLAAYRQFHAATDIRGWASAQCMLAAMQMMLAATACGIDSCALGGFDENRLGPILGINLKRNAIALLLALGGCAHGPGDKQRAPLAQLTEYR